jgi:signal transduction histidine kinase
LLLVGGALAVVLAIAGAALLTNRALAPIARLTRVAAGVAATGKYHERVPLPRYADEIQELALTINTLIATVEATLDQQLRLLADTSHELRSPLTVVLANLNLLRRDLEAGERELSIKEATDEARRMRRLVNELLLLAESDRARAIAQAPVRLDVLVEESVASAARQAPTHTIRAQVTSPIVVMGDEERLMQLMRNLLDNATRHTQPGTSVEVCLETVAASAQIAVADTGTGIPAEHVPHIWDRFYRVDRARSRAGGGTGLGLAIVKFIAEAHGGSVRVVSIPDQGTTFTIVLPLAPAVRQQAEPTPAVLPMP